MPYERWLRWLQMFPKRSNVYRGEFYFPRQARQACLLKKFCSQGSRSPHDPLKAQDPLQATQTQLTDSPTHRDGVLSNTANTLVRHNTLCSRLSTATAALRI